MSSERDAFETALQSAFDFTCYYIGRAVVLVGTLGRLKCDPAYLSVPRRKLRECGFHHRRAGQRYLTREGTHYLGLIAGLALVCGTVVFGYFRLGQESEVPVENPLPTATVVVPEIRPTVSTNYPKVSMTYSNVSTNHAK